MGNFRRKLDVAFERAEDAILIAIMVALFALVTLQVLARLVEQPPTWTEEASRYLMVWLMFFGAAACVRHKEHVGFALLADAVGPRLGGFLRRAAHLATLALMLILFVQGGIWVGSLVESGQTTITFDLPLFWIGLALPVAGLVGALHALRHLVGPAPEEAGPAGQDLPQGGAEQRNTVHDRQGAPP